MIKAVLGTDQGPQTVLLGLSRANTEMLLQGRPIMVSLRALGVDTDLKVVVMAGETEEDIRADITNVFGPAQKEHGVGTPGND